MIKKDKSGYKVVSERGKNLGSGHKARRGQETSAPGFFKHNKD
jgi:hypothetical protein